MPRITAREGYSGFPRHWLDSENAWVAREWISGRTQGDIANQLGVSSATICQRILQFCDHWANIDVSDNQIYSDNRKRYALKALQRYFFKTDGIITYPRDSYIGTPANPGPDLEYSYARHEHAWLLRAEGKTYDHIGDRLGISRERARQMIWKFSRKMRWATRSTRYKVYTDE